jgi:Capsule assembly protein Wzi
MNLCQLAPPSRLTPFDTVLLRLLRRLPFVTWLLLATVSTPALASPWIAVGDRRLREDIELLQDSGLLPGTTTVWPMPWANIGSNFDLIDDSALKPMHLAALNRVKRSFVDQADDSLKLSATVQLTSEPALRRSFGDSAREEADVSVLAEQGLGPVKLGLQLGYRNTPAGKNYSLDGSYVAVAVGNWGLYGGFVEQWWGPSHEGSLLISNTARPFPKVGFTRLAAEPFNSRWLRWMGLWRIDGFVGVLTGQRSDVFTNPLVVGLRATIRPTQGLELGASRMLQLCGSGRPCSLGTFSKALFPIGQSDNTGTFNEPGNQALGLDVRYARAIGSTQAVFHLQGFAEDTLFEAASFQVGASLTGPSRLGTWRASVDAVDTYARIFSKAGRGNRQSRATYLHFIYRDGFGYRGKPLGHSFDGDAQAVTGALSLTDLQNRRWSVSLTRADLNRFSEPLYRASQTREKLWLGEAGVDWPSRIGDIGVQLRGQTDSPNTPGRKDAALQAGLSWKLRF